VVNCYLDLLFGKEKKPLEGPVQQLIAQSVPSGDNVVYHLSHQQDLFATRPGYNPHEYRWGDGTVSILDYYYAVDGETYPSAISTGQTVFLAISLQFYRDLVRPILGITIKTKEGVTVYGVNSETLECDDFQVLGTQDSVVEVETKFTCRLAPGDYFISLGIATRQGEDVTPHDRRYDAIHMQVRPNRSFFGLTDLELNLSARQVSS
jgi:lipopolysaccharide transport system ATP-binding protein